MADRQLRVRVTTVDESSGALNLIKGSFTELNSVVSLARQGIQLAGQVYDATIGQTLEYAQTVRDLSLVTGQGAENTSRLLQVLDDFQISGDQLSTAMRALRERGINPTVQSLARMSEEYLRLNPGLERQNFLADNFGTRIGPQFANMMNQGADAIRRMGEEVSDGLILTDEDIQRTEELRLAVDELNDARQAAINEIVIESGVLETLTGLLQNTAERISEGNIGLVEGSIGWRRMREEQERYNEVSERSGEVISDGDAAMGDFRETIEDTAIELDGLSETQLRATAAQAILRGEYERARIFNDAANDIREEREQLEELLQDLEQLNDRNFNFYVTGTVTWNGIPVPQLNNLPISTPSTEAGGLSWEEAESYRHRYWRQTHPGQSGNPYQNPLGLAKGGVLPGAVILGEDGPEALIGRTVLPTLQTRNLVSQEKDETQEKILQEIRTLNVRLAVLPKVLTDALATRL
jgi:hypothetical protein